MPGSSPLTPCGPISPCWKTKRRPDDRQEARRGRQRLNGEGTISGPRKDGRYVGAFYAPTAAGTRKRIYVYGRTREEVHEKLVKEQARVIRGIPVPARSCCSARTSATGWTT